MHFRKIILLATTLLVSFAARADTVTYTLVGNATGSNSGIGNFTGDSVTYVSTSGYLSFEVKYTSTIATGSVSGSPIDGFEFLSPIQYLFLTNGNATVGYTTAAYEIRSAATILFRRLRVRRFPSCRLRQERA